MIESWLIHIVDIGAASRGDTSEAEPEQPYPSTGGGEEQPSGAAGGGRGGAKEPGETTGNTTIPGMCNHSIFFYKGRQQVRLNAHQLTHSIMMFYSTSDMLARTSQKPVIFEDQKWNFQTSVQKGNHMYYLHYSLKHLKVKALLCNPPFLHSWWRPRKSWRMMWELLKAWRRSRGNCRRTWREPVRNWKKRPSLTTSWRKPRTGFSRSLMTLWWTWTTRDRSSQPWRRNRRSLTRY